MGAKEVTVTLHESVRLNILWTNKGGQVVKAETYGPLMATKRTRYEKIKR